MLESLLILCVEVNTLKLYWMSFGFEYMWQQQQQQEVARLLNPLQRNHSLYFSLLSSSCCPWWCVCVCDVCLWLFVYLVFGGSSQTDNHRGGRTESERDECSVYWNKCKDRLQCQTGRACAPRVCLYIALVLSSDWLHMHARVRCAFYFDCLFFLIEGGFGFQVLSHLLEVIIMTNLWSQRLFGGWGFVNQHLLLHCQKKDFIFVFVAVKSAHMSDVGKSAHILFKKWALLQGPHPLLALNQELLYLQRANTHCYTCIL